MQSHSNHKESGLHFLYVSLGFDGRSMGSEKSTKKRIGMTNKKEKIAIAVGIGAVVGIGITVLASLGLGKTKGVACLGKCHRKK